MVDLEEEFKALIDGVYNEIRRKQVDGELTRQEADELTAMVDGRVQLPDTSDSWCSSSGWESSSLSC